MIRHLISRFVQRCGLEVTRLSKSPGPSLAGIAYLPIQTVLDVGANRGQFARQALRTFPAARIYSFEPVPDAFADLQYWANTDGLQRIVPLGMALGSTNGPADMFLHRAHDSSSSLLATTEHARELFAQMTHQSPLTVQVRTLDSLVKDGKVRLSGATLLKIDVQGYELEVLKGAEGSLASVQAAVVEIGIQPLYHGQGSFTTVMEAMVRAGLHYVGNATQICDSQGRVIYIDAAFMRRIL